MNIPFGLGGFERDQNESDLGLFTGGITPVAPISDVFMPEYGYDVETQSHQPACGPHAAKEFLFILEKTKNGTAIPASSEYGWKKVKLIDNLPLEVGTDILSLMKMVVGGMCSNDLLPNNPEISLSAYADPSGITPEMDADAQKRSITGYAFHASPTFDQIKQAIFYHKAVIMLFRMGIEWWTPSWQEKDILPLKTIYPISNGHFVTAYAYDSQYVYFYNHFGKQWGRAGIGYFAADYAPHCVEIATAVDLSHYQFPRNLSIGAKGTDVGVLQIFLRKKNLFKDQNGNDMSITSYYGPITRDAVKRFQEQNPEKCLVPAGINSGIGTGTFGPVTRAFLNSQNL